MATIKLKSNIMDLVCRTCLKMNKDRFNIFELTQNNKFIPDLIMEFATVQVRRDDGFPVNICGSCLEKLNMVRDFKEMIIESNAKLRNFYQNKTLEKDSQNKDIFNVVMIVKEELPVVKSEKLDSVVDSTYSPDPNLLANNVVQNQIIQRENIVNMNDVMQCIAVVAAVNKSECTSASIVQYNLRENDKDDNIVSSSSYTKEYSQEVEEKINQRNTEEYSLPLRKHKNKSIKIDKSKVVEYNLSDESSDDFDESSDDIDDFLDDTDESSNDFVEDSVEENCLSTKKHKDKSIKVDESKVVEYNLSDESSDDFDESSDDSGKSSDNHEDPNQVAIPTKTEPEVSMNSSEEDTDYNFPDDFFDIAEYKNIKQSGLTKKERQKKKLYCKLCKRSFAYKYFLSVHIKRHIGKTPYKCDVCDKTFVNRTALKAHKQCHTDTKKYSCEVCGKTFKYLSGVQTHRVIHSTERPYKCTVCNKTFKFESVLKNHSLRHQNVKTCVCEVCGKAFTEKSDLYKHRGVHNTDKNFICPRCGKTFSDKRLMAQHLKRHSSDKRFACNHCNKRFYDKQVLNKHILIHTGAKPFSCKICGKAFRQRSCLPRHMRIHTGETPFSCDLCPDKFKFLHLLQNHMKVKHKKHTSQE